MRDLWLIFATVFLAELGDKTQVATLLFAADSKVGRWQVFAAAALALVVSSLLAVLFGSALASFLDPKKIKYAAGIGFLLVGIWTLVDAG